MAEAGTRGAPGAVDGETGPDGLYLGDAIDFFLNAKRAGGRSERTIDDYRKKLELFQRWVAERYGGEQGTEEVDAPYSFVDADEVEAYVVYLRDGRGMADSSRKNHLAVLKSFFETLRKRLKADNPFEDLDEVRFRQRAPKRQYLTKREAEMLLSPITQQATEGTEPGNRPAASSADPRAARKLALGRALAARDHAAFSAMVYAGLRIEETTSLTLKDLSFSRGEEEVRVARGKGNKERVVPMSPKLRRSLRRYLQLRDELALAGEAPSPPPLPQRKGCPGNGEHPQAPPVQVGTGEPHKKGGPEATRLEENLRHLVPAGEPRAGEGAGGAYGPLRPLPGDEVRPIGREARQGRGGQALIPAHRAPP
jgi:site-specific recombinase XerD